MKNGITKEQSKMLQGLAILMMLYHHLFATADNINESYKSVLIFGNYNAELKLALFAKLTVAVYAFVSGYGLCKSLKKQSMENDFTNKAFSYVLGQKYLLVLKKLLHFFIQYWIVFIVFMPFRFFINGQNFEIKEFVSNLFGVSSTYNGTWWYVLFYAKMILVLPLIDSLFYIFKNRNAKICHIIFYITVFSGFIIAFILRDNFWNEIKDFMLMPFMTCFLMGYIFAKCNIYELVFKLIPEKIVYILGIAGFILSIAVRLKFTEGPMSIGLDHVLVPVFAFGFAVIMHLLPKLGKLFAFLGTYSTFIWLTHIFFMDKPVKYVVMLTHLSTGIFITLTAISLIASIALNYIYKWINKKMFS